MQNQNKDILGFLYYDEDGRLCVANDTGTHVVLVEHEDQLHHARGLILTESRDITWANGDFETWDANIFDDLIFDLRSEGKDPEKEFSCENSKYSTIIISS